MTIPNSHVVPAQPGQFQAARTVALMEIKWSKLRLMPSAQHWRRIGPVSTLVAASYMRIIKNMKNFCSPSHGEEKPTPPPSARCPLQPDC